MLNGGSSQQTLLKIVIINKCIEYIKMASASVGQAIFIILIFIILIGINIMYIHINALKSHWSEYKCTQWATYLAPMIGEDATSSFSSCVTDVQNANNTLNATQSTQDKQIQFASMQATNNASANTFATSAGITGDQTQSLQQNINETDYSKMQTDEIQYVREQDNKLRETQQNSLHNMFFTGIPNMFTASGGDWLGIKPVYDQLKSINNPLDALVTF